MSLSIVVLSVNVSEHCHFCRPVSLVEAPQPGRDQTQPNFKSIAISEKTCFLVRIPKKHRLWRGGGVGGVSFCDIHDTVISIKVDTVASHKKCDSWVNLQHLVTMIQNQNLSPFAAGGQNYMLTTLPTCGCNNLKLRTSLNTRIRYAYFDKTAYTIWRAQTICLRRDTSIWLLV